LYQAVQQRIAITLLSAFSMKNPVATPKFQLRKTIVTRFSKPATAGAFMSSSILNTSSRSATHQPA
jgi:hypothetical protein